jgi:alkylation response protein AidB-like acyl-CoA dehydrogenase
MLFKSMVEKMFEKKLYTVEWIADHIDEFLAGMISMTNMSPGTLVRFIAHYGLYCKSLKNLGTEKHRKILLDGVRLKDFGSFSMTELAHGSNVRGI